MTRPIKRKISAVCVAVVACTALSSCATGYYVSSDADEYATFVLRTVSDDIPIVEMVVGTETYRIPASVIVKPYSAVKKEQQYKLAAGEKVKLNFTYHWVGEELSYPRTHSSGSIETIQIEKSKSMESCSASVSFVPAVGVHYEAYFRYAMGRCDSWMK